MSGEPTQAAPVIPEPAEAAPVIPDPTEAAPVIVVTGTSAAADIATVTAALIVGFHDEGLQVCLTSVGASQNELSTVERLTGPIRTHLPRAATVSSSTPLGAGVGPMVAPMPVQAATWSQLSRQDSTDILLVLDPHGLGMPIDPDGATLLDLIDAATGLDLRIGVVLACDATPDTLRQAALVAPLLQGARVDLLGCVLAQPGPGADPHPMEPSWLELVAAQVSTVTGAPVLGRLPEGAATWPPEQFRDRAGAWLPVR